MKKPVNKLLKNNTLVDPFDRHITYLRLSVTDRCDLRCTYCMPEKMTFLNKKEVLVDKDEQPYKAKIEKIPSLRPAFRKNGTVTAANSSSISDGASSVILMLESEAQKRGIKPLARIIDHSTNSQEPKWFTTAPIGAIEKVLEKSGWKKTDVDLFEVNEAFAVVPMAVMKDIGISNDILNIYCLLYTSPSPRDS